MTAIQPPSTAKYLSGDVFAGVACDPPIVVSGEIARAYGGPLRSLGSHQLCGLATPQELFAPVVTGSFAA
jgi:hypothetical protein